jgi:hypothetical protein
MGRHRLAGVTPNQIGEESGTAAYEVASLHPRITPSGRYAAPERRYVYGASPMWLRPPSFQKPVAMERAGAAMCPEVDRIGQCADATT